MLSIDEAIAQVREVSSRKFDDRVHCIRCSEFHKQIAEWLEELKDYRDKNKMVVRVYVEDMDSIKDKIDELSKYTESQYNKAIDDIKEKLLQNGFIYTQHALDVFNEIAEQLKEGVNINE